MPQNWLSRILNMGNSRDFFATDEVKLALNDVPSLLCHYLSMLHIIEFIIGEMLAGTVRHMRHHTYLQ